MKIKQNGLVLVTGKGGVGKSLCAAAIAHREAKKGRKVCLMELGAQSFYEALFQTRGIGYEPIEAVPGIHISLLTPNECLKEYVLQYLKVPKLYDIFFQTRVIKAFLEAAPGISEISILGKITSNLINVLPTEYDLFVVDCYSTGHALSLLRAPKGISKAVSMGPIFERAEQIHQAISDPSKTHYVIVTLPEEMPVNESLELHQQLKSEFNADPTIVCTKLLKPPVSTERLKEMQESINDKGMRSFITFLQSKLPQQEKQLQRLRALNKEFYGVPAILEGALGANQVESFSEYLEEPWDLMNS